MSNNYDVIVIGGGHAGCEAASASARMGRNTLLITHNIKTIGAMSCNPAIGGIGKGHVVREIDALDGMMGKIIDDAGIQFRMLNKSKGPAVWGPRAQADKDEYAFQMQQALRNVMNLTCISESVEQLLIRNRHIIGIKTANDTDIYCKALILTTGTFLRGICHIGSFKYEAGRNNEPPCNSLTSILEEYGHTIGRLKTGTPARLDKNTINWEILEPQPGDLPPVPFSYMSKAIRLPQVNCHITYTNHKTHDIITKNISKSAVYSGEISGRGPRYCPSIEDKIVRFADKEHHQIFLEPEGLTTNSIYPNGISTSLPADVQEEFIRSIKGLENAKLLKPGYAVEYDFSDPRQLYSSLQSKHITGLFLAGQINGTTGYEEAAGQGIIAGINASLFVEEKEPFILDRADAYIGVMVDDLTTLGATEPYRLFTSRAEYRIQLRADNADQRLTPLGIMYGCISDLRKISFESKMAAINETRTRLRHNTISPNEAKGFNIHINQDGIRRSAYDLLTYNHISISNIINIWPEFSHSPNEIIEAIAIEATYANYLKKQELDIMLFKKEEALKIPTGINYDEISSLSNEVREKLKLARPQTIGQISRIPGITPAAAMAILIFIRMQNKEHIYA